MTDSSTPVDSTNRPEPLGSIYLPATGTPVGHFDFIVDTETGLEVEIGTPIAADTAEGTVVGSVVDMRTVGIGRDPVAADLGSSYDQARIAAVPEVMVADVQVFHSNAMRPVRAGVVRSASAEEMLLATGYHAMEWPIPAGVVPLADGSFAKVCFDGRALLGPESAHLMVGGLSGQAAKTSYTSMLLRACLEAGDNAEDSTAALIFNVKGEDLIFLDEPPAAGYELSDEDLKIYTALGIPATPFEDVTVYAPALPAGGKGTRSPRPDAVPIRWDLQTVWPYLRYFFPAMNWFDDQILQAFLSDFSDLKLNGRPGERITTFAELESWMDDCLYQAAGDKDEGREPSQNAWRSHHVASFRRFKRMLTTLPSRGAGIITKETASPSEDIPTKGWHHGEVVVVDIAGLPSDIQGVIIARTLDRLMKSAEAGELGVSHLAVSFDELNSFAPSQGSEMGQVRKILQRVATQGRYAGISLFGAGQALSKVDEMVTSNAASRALGRTADLELASGAYGRLSSGVTERIATMPKGRMMLWHYSFRAPLMVRFPRPAWRTGRPKTSGGGRPKTTAALGLKAASLERLTEGLRSEQVEHILDGSASPAEARAKLEAARVPDMKRQALHEPATVDPLDPFNLDD